MGGKYIQKLEYIKGIPDNSYLNKLSVIQYLKKNKFIEFNKDVTFLSGNNGTGKSTLIEALALCCGFNAEGGSKNFNFSTRHSESDLFKYLSSHPNVSA